MSQTTYTNSDTEAVTELVYGGSDGVSSLNLVTAVAFSISQLAIGNQ